MMRIGDWSVYPATDEIARNGRAVRVEARTMRLLLYLAEHAGEVVSIEELLKEVWPGVIVTSDSVYQAVASLRRVLGDDPKQPTYIATVPRRGYALIASVGETAAATASGTHRSLLGAGVLVALAAAIALVLHSQSTKTSIAILGFIDLTDGMTQEAFVDGMTDEIVDKLSKVPTFRVTAPMTPKPEDATYVLDGSVRRSPTTYRIAARLSRADNHYVVWSETYDRPVGDLLAVQDDIATQVARALKASIDSA
jgi:transcriptional activator of cad operon